MTSEQPQSLAIDRAVCTAHGICAGVIPEAITLDEWGFPVVHGAASSTRGADAARRLCPVAALRVVGPRRKDGDRR